MRIQRKDLLAAAAPLLAVALYLVAAQLAAGPVAQDANLLGGAARGALPASGAAEPAVNLGAVASQ